MNFNIKIIDFKEGICMKISLFIRGNEEELLIRSLERESYTQLNTKKDVN